MAAIRVSVVICTRDRPDAVVRCLTALVEGFLKPDEIVLVDQGLADDVIPSRAIADAGIALVHHRIAPAGTSRARNEGIMLATGSLIAFTDDDCVPQREWLEQLVRAAGTVGAAAGRVLPLDAHVKGLVPVSSRTSTRRIRFEPKLGAIPWDVGTGGNLIVHRRYLEAIGGFDELFGPGARYPAAEDIDLIDRLLWSGCSFLYEPDAVVLHEMKSRRARVRSRYPYGRGMGAFIAADRQVPRSRPSLLSAYLTSQLATLRRGLLSLRVWQTIETACVLVGFVDGFVSYLVARRRAATR